MLLLDVRDLRNSAHIVMAKIRPALLLTLVACLSAGCSGRPSAAQGDDSGPPVRGGTLEVVGRSDVDHLATTSSVSGAVWWLFGAFARQLLAYPTVPIWGDWTKLPTAPDLALLVPTPENGGISANGLLYTFHLRRGVRWNSSPPREVTAHDVVRGFKLLCNPVWPVLSPQFYTDTIAGMARYCEEFRSISRSVEAIHAFINTHDLDGLRADDDFTVVFRLLTPAADFLNLLALPYASPVPAEYLDYLPDSPEFREHTLSNGP